MFTWISDFFYAFGKLFPRIFIVKKTHRGLKFVWGSDVREIEPGIHWYWPLITKYKLLPINEQVLLLNTQTLITADNVEVSLSAFLIYKIIDIKAAILNAYDIYQIMDDRIQGIILEEVRENNFEDLINIVLTEKAGEELAIYGVEVVRCRLANLSKSRTFRLIQE